LEYFEGGELGDEPHEREGSEKVGFGLAADDLRRRGETGGNAGS
jgi:hypothetical protein